METSDIIAISSLPLMDAVGARSKAAGMAAGLLLACAMLAAVGLCAGKAWFLVAARPHWEGGVIIPAAAAQAARLAEALSERRCDEDNAGSNTEGRCAQGPCPDCCTAERSSPAPGASARSPALAPAPRNGR